MSPAGGGRPLSSVPRPLSGVEGPEAFGSFVERVAARQLEPTSVWTILVETGLLPQDRFDAPMPVAYGINLTPEQHEAFVHVCKLEPGELEGLLLRSLDGVAFDLSGLNLADGDSVRAVGAREWAGFAGSACCSACLGETGGWRLRWRLWTSFVCLTHGRLLINRCPGCGQRTAVFRRGQGTRPLFATHMPRPGHCGNGVPHGRRTAEKAGWPCGHDLRDVPSPDLSGTPRLLATQRAVNAVLNQQGRGRGAVVAGQQVSALTYFGHLRSLVALALHAAQPADLGELPLWIALALHDVCERRDAERLRTAGVRGTRDHPYKAAPDDTRLVAATLPWATELLASPDQAGITAGLRPLIERSREVRGSAVRALGRDFHLKGPLAAALAEVLAPRANFQRGLGHLAPAGTGKYRTFSPSLVPHLIWQEDYERDFLPLLEGSGIGETAARVAIGLALVRLTGPHPLPASVTLLGLDGLSKGASSNPMVGHLGRTGGCGVWHGPACARHSTGLS